MSEIYTTTGVFRYIGNADNTSSTNSNLDAWYGPYNGIDEAKTLTQAEIDSYTGVTRVNRYVGMTVGILDSQGHVSEYWFRDGIADDDLIPKIPDINIPEIENLPGNIKVAKFNANGGVGHQNSELTDDDSYIHLPECVFTNTNGTFQGWDTTNASQNPKAPGTDVFLSQSTTFYAIWDNIISYTVNFDDTVIACTLNGNPITDGSSVASGSTVVFTYANTAADKAFSNWTGFQTTDNVSYGHSPETATIQVTRNLNIDCIEDTLYKLTIRNVLSYGSLTLDVNTTGAIPAPSSIWLAYGSVVEIAYTANTTGWSISDWQCTGVNPTSSTDTVLKFTMPSNNVNVSPQEQQASTSFTIRFYEDDNDQSSYIGYYSSSSSVTLQTAVAGMTVDGSQPGCVPIAWAEFGTTTAIADTYMLNGDMNLYVLVKKYQITLAPSPSIGGTCTQTNSDGLYYYNEQAVLTATPNTGYDFTSWTLAGQTTPITGNPLTITVTGNATYLANFSPRQHTITVQANPTNGGTVSGGGLSTYGSQVSISATAATGYRFVNWTLNGAVVSTTAQHTVQVLGDATYVANFVPEYTITVEADPTNGGTVTGAGTYGQGELATLVANASTGYTFVNWTFNGSGVSVNSTYTVPVNSSGNYIAHFSQNNYTISATVNPDGSGTVNNGPSFTGTYHYGDPVTLTAQAAANYTFSHWDDDTSDTNPNKTITVTQNESHVAHFTFTPPSQVSVVGLSGTKKYASTIQDRIDNGTITSSQYTCTLGQENTIAIVRNNATNDTKGYSVLLPQGYKVNANSVHFYDAVGNEYDKTQYQVTCTHGLPSSSSDSTVIETFTYNGTTLQGYFMSLNGNTPTTVKFIIENE